MSSGDNATCNGCLAHREKWAGNNTERVKELWQKYHAENTDTIRLYSEKTCIVKLRWIVRCAGGR